MGMRARIGLMAVLLLVPGVTEAQAQEAGLFDAAGYRIAYYRSPVHRPPEGVGRIAPAAIAGLRPDVDMILIDVLPAEGGHRAADGRWQLAQRCPLVSRKRAGRADAGYRRLVRARGCAADRGEARPDDRHLLPGGLLDGLECGATAAGDGLSQHLVAGRGDRWLARPGARSEPRPAGAPIGPKVNCLAPVFGHVAR
jgi:hypothetical protein